MPKKETGMPFELHPSPMKDAEGRNILYAIPMQRLSTTLQELDDYCCTHSGLSRNQLVSVFNYFTNAAAQCLAHGERIVTPMGTFAPRLALEGQFVDPAAVHADDVRLRGIDFQPSKAFMSKVLRWNNGFHTAPTSPTTDRRPDEKQLQKALCQCMKNNDGSTTVSIFKEHSGLSRHLAQRYLDSLCEGDHPQLKRIRMGHAFIYTEVK